MEKHRKRKGRTTAVLAAAFLFLGSILLLGEGLPNWPNTLRHGFLPDGTGQTSEQKPLKGTEQKNGKNRFGRAGQTFGENPLERTVVSEELTEEERQLELAKKGQADSLKRGGQLQINQTGTGSERHFIGFQEDLSRELYEISDRYLLVKGDSVNLRAGPSKEASVITVLPRFEKLLYPEPVTGPDGVLWYQACFIPRDENGQPAGNQIFGFVSGQVVQLREFQYGKMFQALKRGEECLKQGKMTYISNYRNYHGMAPLYRGMEQDPDGGSRDQSAPGYISPGSTEEFRYLEDGTLVLFLGRLGELVHVRRVSDGADFYVPKQYILVESAVKAFEKVIVIDVTNQNEAVFENRQGTWYLLSRTFATTGAAGTYHIPTPTGYFLVMEKRERFYYLKDGTDQVQGYAPYALRFAGGAYVHGVATGYQTAQGKRRDPGIREYSKTVGSVPLSHKCVRNYTSHAKFLYDWYEPGKMEVIVID